MSKPTKTGIQFPNLLQDYLVGVSGLTPSRGKKTTVSLSHDEERSFVFSYWLGVALLLQDQPCSPGVVGSFKRLLNNVLKEQDLLGFIEACSDVRAKLIHSGVWNSSHLRDTPLRWVRGLVTTIEHSSPTSLCRHPSRTFDVITTFLGWLKRLPVCIRQKEVAVEAYYECDRRLLSIDFDNNCYIHPLRQIWEEWFGNFQITDPFLPKHGSGATADVGRVRSRKWRSLSSDAVARVCFKYPNFESALDMKPGNPSRVSKVVFVPKQAGKDRTICMEPAWLQFLQQGVASQLNAFTHCGNHPLSRLVNIYSQDVNRSLCAQAHVLGLVTIDLSDASDSVSWRLISKLCKNLPLRRYLYGSRSSLTQINGRVEGFDKFAPMGSALCFPIECYLFASIVELAYRMHFGQASRGHHSGCSVYGDDIICPVEVYPLVLDILTSLGFIVNQSKTSTGPYFESCGVEYLHGAPINSIKHPRAHLYTSGCVSPDQIGLITDLANTLLSFRSFDARRALLCYYKDVVVDVNGKKIPFMDLMRFDDRHCIPIVDSYANTHWNSHIQRRVKRYKFVETIVNRSPLDYIEYQSRNVRRSRDCRIYDQKNVAKRRSIDPKWSQQAVLILCKTHWWDLLETGDVEVAGIHRTGRLRHKVRNKFLPS